MSLETPFEVRTPLVTVAVTLEGDDVSEIRLHGRAGRGPEAPREQEVARELGEFARGERQTFTFAVRPQGTAFEQRCWEALLRIPYGETRTYGQIAQAIGRPGAARAVGAANGKNPIAIAIPCHRVVAADGGLGGYGGGLDLKRRLLALEQRAL